MRAQRDLSDGPSIRIAIVLLAACLGLADPADAQVVDPQVVGAQVVGAQGLAHASTGEAFELADGDRVVMLGSGFIEAEQTHGYVELALTTRWPDRDVTFRNVGWSGDTVFGEARIDYTNRPGPYERLLDQATAPRPTVLFVGYGANVPFEEGDAVGRFEVGLRRLLMDLETETNARIVLLSPPPHEADASPAPAEFVHRVNARLKEVSDAIERVARDREHRFVDLFGGLAEAERTVDVPVTADGVQLNAAGYFLLARVLEEGLGLPPRGWSLRADVRSGDVEAKGGRVSGVDVAADHLAMTFEPELLSMPPPETLPMETVPAPLREHYARHVAADGLAAGTYKLTWDGLEVAAAPSGGWADGIAPSHSAVDDGAERLRRLIVEKNRLYFQQYRPPNETYLVGFRSYEQGRNAEEIDRLTPLIRQHEREIGRLSSPVPATLMLVPGS